MVKNDLPSMVDDYAHTLSKIYDNHAPEITKNIILRPNTEWYKANIRQAKTIRRRKERKKDKTGNPEDKLDYKKQCEFVNFLVDEAKCAFYSTQILETEEDKRKCFSLTKRHYELVK